MRLVKRRRDRAPLDARRRRNRLVVKVGVVAQKQDQPLLLRQRRYRRPQLAQLVLVAVPRLRRCRRCGACERAPLLRAHVRERPPQPRLEAPLTAERGAAADRPRERLLHRVVCLLTVPDHPPRNLQEPAIPPPIARLDTRDRRLRVRHLNRMTRHGAKTFSPPTTIG